MLTNPSHSSTPCIVRAALHGTSWGRGGPGPCGPGFGIPISSYGMSGIQTVGDAYQPITLQHTLHCEGCTSWNQLGEGRAWTVRSRVWDSYIQLWNEWYPNCWRCLPTHHTPAHPAL